MMTLLTEKDLNNLRNNRGRKPEDIVPSVRLYSERKEISFLLYELNENNDTVCGLYGQGLKKTKLKSSTISKLEAQEKLKRDENFIPVHSLSVYLSAAEIAECIVESPQMLDVYARLLKAEI